MDTHINDKIKGKYVVNERRNEWETYKLDIRETS